MIIETVEQVALHVAWARYNDHGELGRLSWISWDTEKWQTYNINGLKLQGSEEEARSHPIAVIFGYEVLSFEWSAWLTALIDHPVRVTCDVTDGRGKEMLSNRNIEFHSMSSKSWCLDSWTKIEYPSWNLDIEIRIRILDLPSPRIKLWIDLGFNLYT